MIRRVVALLLLLASPCFAVSAYRTYFVNTWCAEGCDVYWPMDETSGTTLANLCGQSCGVSAASAYNLTTHATPTLNQTGASGQKGGAVLFAAGSSQYADVTVNDTGSGPGDLGSSKTFGCWENLTDQNFGSMMSHGTGATSYSWTINTGDHLQMSIFQSGGATYATASSSGTFTTGVWRLQATVVQPGTKVEVFSNGVSVGSTTTFTGSPGGGNDHDIARRQDGTNYKSATIQDCFEHATALTAANLLDMYNHGIRSPQGWSWSVKLDLPHFRDDGYDLALARYTRGLWNDRERPWRMSPMIGLWPTFAVVPDGHGN